MIRESPDVLKSMKILLVPILASLVCCTRLGAASTDAPAAGPASHQPDLKIDALLRGLADESFRVREQSTRELWEMGESALPALRGAVSSADPEQAVRARDLLRKIQLHITPDTDPSVISLVESYSTASPAEKAALLGKMRGKRAWRQMLKLYAAESQPELREKLRPMMSAVAVKAARERLIKGDAPGAREFLEMAPADAANLLALAEFHRSHGTLEAELQRAMADKGPKAAAWRLALQRAAGNPVAARDEAFAAGENQIAVVMAALAGDPLPFLRKIQDQGEVSPAAAAYAAIVAKRWQGEKVRKDQIEPLTRMLSSRDPDERGAALNVLFLLGEVDAAEPVFMKAQPLAAFRHFEALERIPEALRAFGFEPETPDFKPWVEKRFDRLLEGDVANQNEVSDDGAELVVLANFLERRGLHAEAAEAFTGPLAAMAEKDPNAFVDFLGKLFGSRETLSGAPGLARKIGVSWAGDDEKRWEEIVIAAFGDDDRSKQWWNWLAEIKPQAGREERLDAMLALSGIGPDPAGLRAKWLALLWQAVESADPNQREPLLERISELAAETGDVATSLKVWDQLPPDGRGKIFWGLQIVHLSAAERWNEAADVILKQITAITEADQEPTADLHAYAAGALRAAGRHEEAAAHDRWVDQLALGSAEVAVRVGNGYAFGRDYRRAADWWAKAAIQAQPESEEFIMAIKLHSDALLEQEKWTESAATSEVIAAIYSGSDFQWANQLPLMRQRLQADMARSLARLSSDRAGSLATLGRCHRIFASDGSLADFFFPALRKAGLLKEHDAWFLDSWKRIESALNRYPECENTRNTAAWFAARSMRKLDAAEQHLRRALASNPNQSAYLDTMAEIQFARGNRDKALEWSALAVNYSPEDTLLRRQHERFRSEPFPR
jgi:hypothetical protein